MVLIVERPQESTQLHTPAGVGAVTNTLRNLVQGVLVAGWSDVGLHKPPSANPRTVFELSLSGIEGQTKRPGAPAVLWPARAAGGFCTSADHLSAA